MPHIDAQDIVSTATWWLVDQIFSLALLEAFGISAMITLIVRRFTSMVSSMRETFVFGGLLFAAILIAINSFGARDLRPYLSVELI